MNLANQESIPSHTRSRHLERAAREALSRATLDSRVSVLDDAEWVQVRTKLVEFANILRDWDQKARNNARGLGNVEVICQREP